MKKNVFWLAAMTAAVSMTGCSLDEVVDQMSPKAIGFSSFVGKPTRAATEIVNPNGSTDGGKVQLSKIYVFGNYGETTGSTYDKEVFNNDEVTVTGDGTNTTTTKYWVPSKSYMFAAYSDGNNKIEGGVGNPSVSFGTNGRITIADYSAGNNDLILATPAEVTTGDNVSGQTVVDLDFKHLLSQVAFEFKNAFTNGYQVKITKLQFSVPNKATYSYNTSDYSWSGHTEDATKSYTVNSNGVFDNTVSKTSEYNFIIPQSNTSIVASFTATVYDKDGTTQIAEKSFTNVELKTGTTTNPSSNSDVWTKGYRYKYTANIDQTVMDNMYPIKFDVSVTGWEDAKFDTDLPLN